MKYFKMFFDAPDDTGGGEGSPADAGNASILPSEGSQTPQSGQPDPAPTQQVNPSQNTADSNIVNADGTLKDNWWESFDSTKEEGTMLKNFKTLEGLAKSFSNTKRMVGKPFDPTNFPDEASKKEFYEKLGVPETAEGYQLQKPDGFPEDMEFNQEQVNWFQNISKKYNLTKEQAQGVQNEYFNMMATANQSAQSEMNEVIKQQREELSKEWGEEGSTSWNANLEQAQKAIKAFSDISGRNVAEDIKSIGLDNNPTLFRLLSQIGANVGEKELAGVGTGNLSMTKEQAQNEYNSLLKDKALFNKHDPEHDQKIKRKSELMRIIHGDAVYAEF